ncbi:hypothetical protein [Polaribacter ponticola]|uniref:Uncharacterized protein n=1 Tax=Polaribacter ponticola TaxID=2978475 RepID=A0ABT5S7D2_9FLAO|nr:hypothetical protein [Polaribacter sp. MSW5]MDD7914007.1 hypothetical protein [Polaribacter sp. MSW5]
MSDFKIFFEALKGSLINDEFVKLTFSKPIKKSEGLLNVYMRQFDVDKKQVFQLKYRFTSEEKYKQFSLKEIISEIEILLLNSFRTATLFTLNKDLLIRVSKKKMISYIENAPSFKNKLPEIPLQS